ncbi:hypothetical protein GCM10011452_09420 [Gemmobacter lanyuensis]|uniref:Uncharacterized protein n=1 Tax=Gemmobacter lanyuensis TaxID=1054497 RepID=A0A918IP96_9RHOB|nr:hypothetical protein [Gemmobacter lanyuensis]GGW24104.1 hypothetical protein GCM10011452_09420 [Gemmobacter lanyuensis]
MSSDLEDRVTELEFAISALDGAEPVAQLTGGRTISLSQIVTELDHTKSDVAGLGAAIRAIQRDVAAIKAKLGI